MEPCLLALDTSTERMALALLWPGGSLAHVEAGGAAASGRLIPAAIGLLAQAGLSMQQLDAIAFGAGPGAFTGLRTACAVAQGLAFGIGQPVLPLDSLMLVAEDALGQAGGADALRAAHGPLWVAMDARMDEVYAAAYAMVDGRWQVRVAPALYALDALSRCWEIEPPAMVAGSAIAAFGDRLPVGSARTWPVEHHRGEALARLARRAWAPGLAIDPALALPLYLRDKVALTTEERAVRAAARA
ncbi:tRNA (adenosine(37)-N6)-threonylcarbamoyltransferase complex dimerization subunit type 1 TsaB [Ideonella sp. A 288]|uniref:tRNA (adenosine(37)-N6)-threonylcarbamoyltransferase complex dimerization subunit type 1 TsaB n=1 Tax=Ideonella sp. A 288 TaxID=1962181 RepID=UPI000B4BC8DC|nr:tRNA (adenosine(37)-N6)-threonylcarbamoyltransferase complex dimerization subunit type 1 TsaB [Ideonella sp. A 288]